MKCFRIRLLSLFFFGSLILISFSGMTAQNKLLDSLRQTLSSTLEDTNRVRALNNLARNLGLQGNYNEAHKLTRQAFILSEKLGDKTGAAEAKNRSGSVSFLEGDYKEAIKDLSLSYYLSKENGNKIGMINASINISNVYTNQGNFAEALKTLTEATPTCQELHDHERLASLYNNIGLVHEILGNFPEALKYFLQTLKIREELKNPKLISDCYNNIGLVYEGLHNYPEALRYNQLSLKTRKELDDRAGIAQSYNNLGIIYNDIGNYSEGLKNHQACLEIHLSLGDKLELGKSYNNIGLSYMDLLNYPEALRNFQKTTEIRRQMEDRQGLSESYINLGTVYTRLKRFQEAKIMLDSAEWISLQIHLKPNLEQTYDQWIRLDSAMGNYKEGYIHLKKYLIYHDSLFNEASSQKTVRAEMNFEFDKKQAIAKSEQERITAVAAAESKRQKIVIASVSSLLLLILAFALFAYRNFRIKKRINLRLEIQKKNIDDSIRYALRIQQAILPKALFLTGEVKEHFLLYLPKDIVSGDFYWRHQQGRELFFAAVDCTGHGVPGAMMSMLGYDLLEHALKDRGLREPAEILNLMNAQIIEKLNTDHSETATDGMDLTLCRFNLDTRELVYAGAKNDLFLFSGQELTTLRVTKCSIGYSSQMIYTQSTKILKNNDEVFLLTDGYSDQKGGPEKKKFMIRKLKTLLEEISPLPCPEQESRLLTAFKDWKGDDPQKDDVLFVGFRV
jgi:serine phosphatase RsbU (regulator of sigma subunit)